MKLIGSLYQDKEGNLWLLKKESLPKKKGVFTYWIAESITRYFAVGSKTLRGDNKRELLKQIQP
jgi:hypothetical protein